MSKATQLSVDGSSTASLEMSSPADQSARTTSIAAILAKDEERQIQGVDFQEDLKASLDYAAETEEDDELAENEAVEDEARANQSHSCPN
jgi:hypothetical protein